MRNLAVALLVGTLGTPGILGTPGTQGTQVRDVTTWYFYKVKWGHQDEFLDLFQRNHYPILKEMEKAGLYLSVRTFVPENHGDGRSDWTFAVELVSPAKRPASPTEEEIVAKLYPDRAKFDR